ncbi:MAG TPA: hypothetical protein VN627_03975 [Novosphingobium sp.]|jgi:hypothetical protein|nr:hypothetical protein [Novosphingobium sp.]
MRQILKGLIAAVAVMAAAPAMACGYAPCAQPAYVAPVVGYGCNTCGGWVHERLPDPEQQYYYVNQGPTYTGPGNWAPRRVYREGAISGYGYGYSRQYRVHRYYHRHHHGYAARYHHSQRVLRRYY